MKQSAYALMDISKYQFMASFCFKPQKSAVFQHAYLRIDYALSYSNKKNKTVSKSIRFYSKMRINMWKQAPPKSCYTQFKAIILLHK